MRKLSTILLGLVLVSLASLLALSLWLRQPIQTMRHRILFASSKALSQPYNQQVLAGLKASINPSDDIEIQTLALPDNAEEQSVILSHQKLLTGDQVILHSAYSLELTPIPSKSARLVPSRARTGPNPSLEFQKRNRCPLHSSLSGK